MNKIKFIQKLSVQLWIADQRTTEAEEVIQVSYAEEKALAVQKGKEQVSVINCDLL
jgi:hypothetical protein